jgi:hypothetical protein
VMSPDVLPHPLADFAAPASAGTWDVQASPVYWMASAAPADAWTDHDWLSLLGFVLTAEGGAVVIAARSALYLQAVMRASGF